jgi:hypothetical protein
MLCRPCNNARTKPFDQAYQIFSGWVLAAATTLHSKEAIDFAEIYGGAHAGKNLNLLRYFAKALVAALPMLASNRPKGCAGFLPMCTLAIPSHWW